jgi:co-chaperonin GroES (HSP10)
MKLEAIYNAVIVKPIETEETSYGGIIVPDLGNEKNKLAEVVAVGKGYYSVTGVWIETILSVGDTVVLPTMGFSKLEHEGEEYWIGPENQVLARLNN